MNRPFVAFDTETAGRTGAPHLIELGAVRVVDGEAVDSFERLVRPQVPVEPEAARIHGLGDDELFDGEDARAVLSEFFEWVGADWLAAHNAQSDLSVLAFECARHGLDAPANTVLDSLKLARQALTDAPDHKLATLAEHLELELELHRALPDAVACWQVIEASVQRLGGWAEISEARLLELAGLSQTLASCTPLRPRRRPALVRALDRARLSGTSVWLRYGADDSPARLGVLPRLLYRNHDKDYLEGECSQSGTLKTYRLDRIQRIEA